MGATTQQDPYGYGSCRLAEWRGPDGIREWYLAEPTREGTATLAPAATCRPRLRRGLRPLPFETGLVAQVAVPNHTAAPDRSAAARDAGAFA